MLRLGVRATRYHGGLARLSSVQGSCSQPSRREYSSGPMLSAEEAKPGLKKAFPNALDKWLGITLTENYRRRHLEEAGHILLNSIYVKADFNTLQKQCGLEDTFEMWLNFVYLHMWMLLVKLSGEGRDGKIISKTLVALMWTDVHLRLGKIQNEVEQHLEINKKMRDYNDLLRTSFIMYDEGLLKGDCELAGSLWNQIYGCRQDVDPLALERLVQYVRYSLSRLEGIPMESLVRDAGNVTWPLPDPIAPMR